MRDYVVVESRAAGSRGARAAARAEKAAERQKAERRAKGKAFCHRAAVNGVESGVPEGDRVAFEWKMDEGELFHECLEISPDARSGQAGCSPNANPQDVAPLLSPLLFYRNGDSIVRGKNQKTGKQNNSPERRFFFFRGHFVIIFNALTVDRARALLRGGADSSAGDPSALERARVLCAWNESDPTAAAVGSTVEIRSLVSRPSMNGKVGVVVSASASTARFGVRVAGEAKALALRRAMVPPPLAGSSLWTRPTPLPFPRPANLEPAAVEVGRLILKAAEWSPQSHELFPEAARKRAVEVMRLGYLIAWDEERFEGREGAAPELADIWRGFVLPTVVAR
ncbi:hypothetical protein EMIHUDRAFT_219277 [Emiliania huxleyi CCMP1516]|uniref:Uncharacterized protein n=2 Tax=Emiliania huxleyi TaxID=2903 RepID=A0A0D3I559_EMIH1|nr:hypothetical protein EMIHUDRAFT_219277 [Emiliania huxleyi CCMP1516]EOD06394.1 hypothetical protein EMIHUDRAFT_219277 [Emiliania huxleyi CCMP1516]|eukprot:XP_005758823.1 hypothetical protein EMIHUDRAFT_219277 [Emiliania huxleyi CCMP1516]